MLTQLLRDNCSHLRLHPPKADNFSTTTLVEATTLATLVLNSSNPQTLAHSLHSPAIQWTPQLVNAVLKCLWNHGPKALQFFNLLSHHPSYSHHASSFDHAIDISARLRDNRTVWALVSRMRSSRLGPSPKTFAIIAESAFSLNEELQWALLGLGFLMHTSGSKNRWAMGIAYWHISVGKTKSCFVLLLWRRDKFPFE